MSDYQAYKVRAVAIELKAALQDLYANVQPLFSDVQTMTLHCDDRALPTPFDVKVTLRAFNALTKPTLQLTSWGRELDDATLDDGLIVGPLCEGFEDDDAAHGIIFPTPGLTIDATAGLTIDATAGLTINHGASIDSAAGLTIPS